MTIYYVYAYIGKNGLPYYIGKGSYNRVFEKHSVRIPKDRNKILFLEKNLSEIGAFAIERRMIRWYGRKDIGTGILQNRTDGGDGASGGIPWNKGKTHSEEHRRKISEALKGHKSFNSHMIPWNKGVKNCYSEEQRAKMGKKNKGKVPWNKGKPGKKMSEEAKLELSKKISEIRKNRFWSSGKKKSGEQ